MPLLTKTPFQEEPLSNQTSIMSFSLVNSPLGECGFVYPSGRSSLAVFSYQILEPYSLNNSSIWLKTFSSIIGVPSSL